MIQDHFKVSLTRLKRGEVNDEWSVKSVWTVPQQRKRKRKGKSWRNLGASQQGNSCHVPQHYFHHFSHPQQTVLISTGRGDVIDDDSLIHALRSGWLGGAILDVFNEEPLPSSSPLWTMSGVTITPHVSACTDPSKSVQTITDNLRRYLKGEPLKNMVDLAKGY